MQLSQDAELAPKSEVQDPQVHEQRQPFFPCTVQGPIVTSTVRRCRAVGDDVNGCGEGESPAEVEGVGINKD